MCECVPRGATSDVLGVPSAGGLDGSVVVPRGVPFPSVLTIAQLSPDIISVCCCGEVEAPITDNLP